MRRSHPSIASDEPPPVLYRLRLFDARRFIAAAAVVALLSVALAGCASKSKSTETSNWDEEVLAAHRLQDRGKYEEAEERFRKLLEEAGDREDRRYVRLQLARLSAAREQTDEALQRYETIWSAEVDDEIGARAMYETSELLLNRSDQPERARALRRRLVRRFPESMWAERSVETLADYYQRNGSWDDLAEVFEELHAAVADTAVGDDLLFTLGEVFRDDAGDTDRALVYFERVMERYPKRDFVDDAEWAAARIYVGRQAWRRAVPLLERTAKRVDASWGVGTFNSPYASQARFRLGMIHLTHLSDYERALEHFRRYLEDFPRNARADDSAWHIAQAYRLMEQKEDYREALEYLVEEFPESRYVERANEQLRKIR